jgi:protein-tyrosine phosphatase
MTAKGDGGMTPARQVRLDGCLNFRDLGGLPTLGGGTVRPGLLYRSDALHHLTPADVALVRDQLRIGDVIDLRSSAEVRVDGQGPLAAEPVRFHHVPLFDGDTRAEGTNATAYTLADRYVMLAEFARAAIARVVTLVADAPGPAVYHCAAGKDRTGVVSAVLLGLLDVADQVIVADYATTRENLDAIVERLMATRGYRTMLSALPPDTLHAEPETMETLLVRVRERYGSMRGYALAAGVSEAALGRLEARLLG